MKQQNQLSKALLYTLVIGMICCIIGILATTSSVQAQYPPDKYSVALQAQWNLISVPVNVSIDSDQLIIRNNSIDYSFTEAVNQGIIIGTIFGWNREFQEYSIVTGPVLLPGEGYWVWANYPCFFIVQTNVRGDGYITSVNNGWNIIGQTYNSSCDLVDLMVVYNGTAYSWADATSANNEEGTSLLLSSLFRWSGLDQVYIQINPLKPGEGIWMYAFFNCSIHQEIVPPVIVDNSADEAGTGSLFVVNASVFDADGVASVWLQYWFGDNADVFVEMNHTGNDNYYETKFPIPVDSLDVLSYVIAANDTRNHWNMTAERVVLTYDSHAPVISNVSTSPTSASQGDYVNVSVDVFDNIAVCHVQLVITYPEYSVVNLSMNKASNYYLNQSYSMGGVYEFLIWANDTSGNSNMSSTHTFDIVFTETYNLTLTKSGTGSGAIEANRTADLYYGDVVRVWANASVGSSFAGFSGGLTGVVSPQDLMVTGNMSVDAKFNLETNLITNINSILPYVQTTSPLVITSIGEENLDNVTLYYRYSNDNNTWPKGGFLTPEILYFDNTTVTTNTAIWTHPYYNSAEGDLIIITVSTRGGTAPSSITYGGQALTLLVEQQSPSYPHTNWPGVAIYALKKVDFPAVGTNNLIFNTTQDPTTGATSFYMLRNVSQNLENIITGSTFVPSSKNISTNINPSNPSIIIDAVTFREGGNNVVVDENQTLSFYSLFESPRGAGSSYKLATTGYNSMEWFGGIVDNRIRHVVALLNAEQMNIWQKFNNTSNPDISYPWSWDFDFPDGDGYYEFFSIGAKDENYEPMKDTAEARCYYSYVAPIVNTSVDPIIPYKQTVTPLSIKSSGYETLHNVTLYYRYSDDNSSLLPIGPLTPEVLYFSNTTVPSNTAIWSHPYYNSGEGDIIIITVSTRGGTAPSSITYGGVVPTLLVAQQSSTYPHDSWPGVAIYAINKTYFPSVGTHNLIFDTTIDPTTGTTSFYMLRNVSQDLSRILTGSTYISWGSLISTPVTALNNSILIDVVNFRNGSAAVPALGQILSFKTTYQSPRLAGSSYKLVTSGATSMGWVGGSSDRIRHVVIAINATWKLDPPPVFNTWVNDSNPDVSYPWGWEFSFPNGTGYYEFYSIGAKNEYYEEPKSIDEALCYYYIPDTTPPEISNVQVVPSEQTAEGYVNITCDVIDDVAVDKVWVNITYPSLISHIFLMSQGSYYLNQTFSEAGTYLFFISANDTSGNVNSSSIFSFEILLGNMITTLNPIIPYVQTSSSTNISAVGDPVLDNITLYYRFSNNNTWNTPINPVNFGRDTYPGGGTARDISSFYYAMQYEAHTTGYVYNITWYLHKTTGTTNFKVAIYDSSDFLLGQGVRDGVGAAGWYTTQLDQPVFVNEGQKYWLAGRAQEATTYCYHGSTSNESSISTSLWSYGNFPQPVLSGTTVSTRSYFVYATISEHEPYPFVVWDHISNPDPSHPWGWEFDFPDGEGFYEFYSIGAFNDNYEAVKLNADAICSYGDMFPPSIFLNFAGNPHDVGGPYYLPGTNIPAPAGYYTNASYQEEDWIYINCTVTDNVGVHQVWLQWKNESTWTNNTYQLTHTQANYYEINMSSNISPGYNYSFDILALDEYGNSALYEWKKSGATYTAVTERRYVRLAGTPEDISYIPYYFYEADYEHYLGYGATYDPRISDMMHHDQGPDGTLTDSGYLLSGIPEDMQYLYCTMFVGLWFDETVTPIPDTLRNIYYRFWWHTDNNELTVAYGKHNGHLYRNQHWGQSYTTNASLAHSNVDYDGTTYHLESRLMQITQPKPFSDNDIYEFFITLFTNLDPSYNPKVISNASLQSFVILNVPNNHTLNNTDWSHIGGGLGDYDGDGLSDWAELYVAFTNPFVADTDNDGFSDYVEFLAGSDPNNYLSIPTYEPVLQFESPTNTSARQPINPPLRITVFQAQGLLMNVSFLTNASGNWETIGTNHSVPNGRYTQKPTIMTEYNTTYYWSVNCTDGTTWTNQTYSFTTRTQYPPILSNPTPLNGSTSIHFNPVLSVTVHDPDGDIITLTFLSNATGVWQELGTHTGGNGTYTQSTSGIDNIYKKYYWRVSVNDGIKIVNATYHFTTLTSIIPTLRWSKISTSGISKMGPVVADLNGDGWMEIIRSGVNGITVYNASNGNVIWTKSIDMPLFHYPLEVIDLNRDGNLEIICAYDSGTMAIYGTNGSEYWYNPNAPLYDKHPVVGDINADGYPEIFVVKAGASDGSKPGKITALTHDGQIFATTDNVYYPCYGGLTLGDFDGDGVFELYLNERGTSYFSGAGGIRSYWASNLTERWKMSDHPPYTAITASSHVPTLVDVTKDGLLEVVSLSQSATNGRVYILRASDGSVLKNIPTSPAGAHSQPTIHDINGDGNLELLTCRDWSRVAVVDLYTAKVKSFLNISGNFILCQEPPAVADITGDGYVEILACTLENISIFNRHYQFIGSIPHPSNTYGASMIIAQDVDNNGFIELVMNQYNQIFVYNTTGKTPIPAALSQFNYYSQQRGRSPYYVPYGPLAPIVKNEVPNNNSRYQPLDATLSIYIYDYQNDLMNITIKTNTSTGMWHNLMSLENVKQGTYSVNATAMNDPATTYWWSVTVTDSTGQTTTKNYSFTTIGFQHISNITPFDSEKGTLLNPILSAYIEDINGNPMNIFFKTNASGSWEIIGSNMSVGNGTYMQKASNMDISNTTYYWSINCTDGVYWTNFTYTFTTYEPPTTLWWNPAWLYRKEIFIDHTKVAGNLKNFPVLISFVEDSDLATYAQINGNDIVFTDIFGNKLNHEIELFTKDTGQLIVWVNVTNLSNISNTPLFLYFGNDQCENQQNRYGTWNNEYLMVHHMNETGDIYDSTSNGLHAINYGTTTDQNGKIDGCRYFDSTTDRYDFGNPSQLNPEMKSWTISFWTKIDYLTSHLMLSKGNYNSGLTLYLYNDIWGGYNYLRLHDGVNSTTRYWSASFSDGDWHYVTAVINRGTNTIDLYLDGVLSNGGSSGSLSNLGPITTESNFLLRGGNNGKHDEFIISNTVRNASWIITCYINQNDPASFYRVYPKQSLPVKLPTITDEKPTNKITNVQLSPILSINVSHEYGYLMNISWMTNVSGIWTVIGTNTSVNDGTYTCNNTFWVDGYYTEYHWSTNVSDSFGTWKNKTYSFTTLLIPPIHDSPLLISDYGTNTTFENLISCNQTTFDPNGLTVSNTYCWVKNNVSLTNLLLSFNTQNTTTVKDYSGHENHGIINDASWIQNGVIGGAYQFFGTDSQTYITIPDDSSLDGEGTWTEMTMECWVKSSIDNQSATTILGKWMSNQNASYELGFDLNGDSQVFAAIQTTSGQLMTSYTQVLPFVTGIWYHVVATYDDGVLCLYIDGVLQTTSTNAGGTINTCTIPLRIGCRDNDAGLGLENFFDGSIDEVRLYPFALSAEQIYQNYLDSKDGLSYSSTIVSQQTNQGDVWISEVTPSNGHIDGLKKSSNPVTIVSSIYTLTINTLGNGSVTQNPDYPMYPSDMLITLTAVPAEGWFFSSWSGDLSGDINPIQITILSNTTVTAHFLEYNYTLTVNSLGNGSVIKEPDQMTYHHNDVVTLTAIANETCSFIGWSGDVTSMENPLTITMTGNKTITATFSINQYTIIASADNGGTITPNGTVILDHGNDQNFTILPDDGYYILDVLVNDESIGAVSWYQFTNVTSNHTISASFALIE